MASKAALLLPLGIDDLHTRLQNVASKQDGSPELETSQSWPDSIASTPSPILVQDLEDSSRKELIRDGGRPVCSIEELSHILAAPMERYEAILSWLSDFPDTETGAGELKTVFSRQFERWWTFRKSQWDSRGLTDSVAGLSAFQEASRRRWEGSGAKAMVSAPSFDETIQRQWQHIPASPQQPREGKTFAAYTNAVKTRLAPHHFTPSLQLRKDPQKQTVWTDWLEYLVFEHRYLEMVSTIAESLEPKYHQSTRRLLRSKKPDGKNIASSSAALASAQTRKPGLGGKGINMAKELAAARADRDASQNSINDFIRETETYTRARRHALYQRHRVEWVIKEARLMEYEISMQKTLVKSKKRKQRDEGPLESQPKRTRQGDGSRDTKAVATPYPRITRQSTRYISLKD